MNQSIQNQTDTSFDIAALSLIQYDGDLDVMNSDMWEEWKRIVENSLNEGN